MLVPLLIRPWLSRLCAAVAACAVLSTAASADPFSARPPAGSAPTIMRGLAPAWVDAYASQGGRVTISPPFGPPQGQLDAKLGDFLDGRSDFALLTREIAETDLARFRAHHGGMDPVIVPVAGGNWNRFGYVDAVVMIVHRDNPLRSLSFRQIDAIFSLTRLRGGAPIATWGELGLRGSWRELTIKIMGGNDWGREESARALTIRRHVLSVGRARGTWHPAPAGGDDGDVVERVAADPTAIGFTGMGHLSPAVRPLGVAAPGKRAVTLDSRSARNGSYPLLRTVDLLLTPRPRVEALAFARFLTSRKGQAIIVQQGDFMPLPKERLRRARSVLSAFR